MPTGEFDAQVREMIASLIAKREQATKPFDDAIRALETISRMMPSSPPADSESSAFLDALLARPKKESSAARTRRVITAILKETAATKGATSVSMSISEIAHQADALAALPSKRGYKGIYADVARVLIRNQHLFAKTGDRGFWKLKEALTTPTEKPAVAVKLVMAPIPGPSKPLPFDRTAIR